MMSGFGQDCIYLIHIMRKSAARFTDSLIFLLWTLSNSLRNTLVIKKQTLAAFGNVHLRIDNIKLVEKLPKSQISNQQPAA